MEYLLHVLIYSHVMRSEAELMGRIKKRGSRTNEWTPLDAFSKSYVVFQIIRSSEGAHMGTIRVQCDPCGVPVSATKDLLPYTLHRPGNKKPPILHACLKILDTQI